MHVGNLHLQHLQSVVMMFKAGKLLLYKITTFVKNTTARIQAAREKDLLLMEVTISMFYRSSRIYG